LTKIDASDAWLPAELGQFLRGRLPAGLSAIGNQNLLAGKKLGLFCSRQCPGELILKSYDLMQNLRDAGVTVISGFHAPMDKECLRILLRGKQPIIVCPARSIEGMRLKQEFREPVEQGRMLVLSPFPAKKRRITAERAEERNRFVAALADAVLFIHAAPGSKTEQLCRELLSARRPVFVIPSQYNDDLVKLDAATVPANLEDMFVESRRQPHA
jgi:predicted Rossmann fold nucleotide-binding protein DprA/Smf involved in DNA uptake